MSAAFGGHTEILKLLLAAKSDVTPADRVQKTAMVYAAGQGATACVQALLDHGVGVNQRYANGATALMWAAAYGHVDTVKLLLARGADASATDERGRTALAIATEEKHPAVADLLRGR